MLVDEHTLSVCWLRWVTRSLGRSQASARSPSEGSLPFLQGPANVKGQNMEINLIVLYNSTTKILLSLGNVSTNVYGSYRIEING